MEYKRQEVTEKNEGSDWATDYSHPQASFTIDWSTNNYENFIICLLTKSKASHNIP